MEESKIKLRAFEVISNCSNKSSADLLQVFSEQLAAIGKSKDRMVRLSLSKRDSEFDLCCNYEKKTVDSNEQLFGTMLRIKSAADVGDISEELLENKTFGIKDITQAKNQENSYKSVNRFYYFFKSNYLVCSLQGNRTIKSFETYINSLIGTENYHLIPLVNLTPEVKVSDVESISFGGGGTRLSRSESGCQRKLISVAKDWLGNLFREDVELKNFNLEDVSKAELILKFRKPKGMSEEDYRRKYGAILKPISDNDDVSIRDRTGRVIKGSEIECSKTVSIEKNEDGILNEAALSLEMGRYITEILNEKTI